MDHRVFLREKVDAASRLQAIARGRQVRVGTTSRTGTEGAREGYRAATRLQAQWRTHLASAYSDQLRWQSKSKLQRTFSWNKKGKRKQIKPEKPKNTSGAGFDDRQGIKPVRRSMSFDRFSRGLARKLGGEDKPDLPPPAMSKQLLFILLYRGPAGLGLELDATNTVVNMVPGGAAEVQGYFREGDTIASVDGLPLRGRLLQDVMDRTKTSYSFDVWRLTWVALEPTAKADKPIRRAFSFDRNRR